MTTAIDEKLRHFMQHRQHETIDDAPPDTRMRHARPTGQPPPPVRRHPAAQQHPASSQPSNLRRSTLYSWIATTLIILLLVALGVSYYQYRAERAAMAARIDAIVRAPLTSPLEAQLLELEKNLVANSSTNKRQMQIFEQRLIENQQAYGQQLHDMEQRLLQMHEPQEQRLQQVEQRLTRQPQPDEKRMQAIENRLDEITTRMDGWAATVANLSSENQPVSPLHAATAAEPPEQRAIEPEIVTHKNTVLQPPKSVPDTSQDKPQLVVAAATAQDIRAGWVINIGSYMREKIAARKLAEFREQGVKAELETAMVRGKTVYRVQVPGFVSMAEARNHASQVQDTLGIKDTWIRRR